MFLYTKSENLNWTVTASQSSTSIIEKMKNGDDFLSNLAKELGKVFNALEAAKSMRDKLRIKLLKPRPTAPKEYYKIIMVTKEWNYILSKILKL